MNWAPLFPALCLGIVLDISVDKICAEAGPRYYLTPELHFSADACEEGGIIIGGKITDQDWHAHDTTDTVYVASVSGSKPHTCAEFYAMFSKQVQAVTR